MSERTDSEALQLSPRLKQVHDLLLLAESEKRIARCLGLSAHTVHSYVKILYRRAGVNTRSEYLLLMLRDSRPAADLAETSKAFERGCSKRSLLFRRLAKIACVIKEADRRLTKILSSA